MYEMIRRCFNNILETVKKTGNSWQEIKKERLWKREDTGDFSSTDPYKMETMPAEGSHFTD
jgi:hypothetical protein